MVSIITALDRTRFTPHLVLFTDRLDHAPPPGVPITVLRRRGRFGATRLISRVLQLRRLIEGEEFDLVVSFLVGPNVVAVAAARLAGVPVVIGERSAPSIVLSAANPALKSHGFWKALVRRLYPRASAVVANTHGAGHELTAIVGVPPSRIAVLPTPVDLQRIRTLAAEALDPDTPWPPDPVLVHVGRLTFAKDHETLLKAFAVLRAQRPATLVLIGGGEDEARVRQLCATLGLDKDVRLVGFTRNPYQYLARATICVLTSRFEGLPNVLIEAMALGVPIVSTACNYGPVELIADGETGVLVPVGDAPAVASAVLELLDDPERRRRLSRNGLERAEGFDQRRVVRRYEELFERIKSTHATSTRESRRTPEQSLESVPDSRRVRGRRTD